MEHNKRDLGISEHPTPEEVEELYDKVVGFLSSDDDENCYCPDKYVLVEHPDLMKRDDMTRSLKALSHCIPLLSEEQKNFIYDLADEVGEEALFYCGDTCNLCTDVDLNTIQSVRYFYNDRFRAIWKFLDKIKPAEFKFPDMENSEIIP